MKLSKTSTQAAFALVYLSDRREGGPTQARQIAEHLGVPTDSALKVLQALVRHDVLRSQLGRSGGYCLDRDPASVSLLEIIEAIDGPVRVDMPASQTSEPDPLAGVAELLHQACRRVAQQTRAQLREVTVAQLAESYAGDPVPPAELPTLVPVVPPTHAALAVA